MTNPATTSTPTSMAQLPNFVHLGPGKSGSTWLHEVLSLHPQVYLTAAKDLYFFSRYFERGPRWYAEQFADCATDRPIIGEVCPDYLSDPAVPQRIHVVLGDGVRLMVTLRDPVDRAFSSYLYLAKHGLAGETFRDTWKANPELIAEGCYADQLRRFAAHSGRQSLYVSLFDDLQANPQGFFDATTDWLGIERLALPADELAAKLPASSARLLPLAKAAQRGAQWVREHDGAQFVGRIKRSAVVQRLLYRPLGTDRPTPSATDVAALRAELWPQVVGVEQDFGLDLIARWGWT
jgi:hypothetical protein